MSSQKPSQELGRVKQLETILDSCTLELTPVDEVWPGLYIGNVAVAQNKKTLCKLGITHVLNAAHSKQGSIGDQRFYGDTCVYFGIPAEDSDEFNLSQHFRPAAEFIHTALKTKDGKSQRNWQHSLTLSALMLGVCTGKVLVHCIMGVSRSASLVVAYLMLHQRLTLSNALKHVIQKRSIYPNRHFLSLLLKLDDQLSFKRRFCPLL
ncbi:hypothetical protein NL108_016482 [Boleophthalmus pectinirostris]|nr:hypothetical protein NL108_016482 [Boleophthalmus pectinirostris]